VERQRFPEIEKIQEGPVERETNYDFLYDFEGLNMTDRLPRGYDCNCGLLLSLFAETEA